MTDERLDWIRKFDAVFDGLPDEDLIDTDLHRRELIREVDRLRAVVARCAAIVKGEVPEAAGAELDYLMDWLVSESVGKLNGRRLSPAEVERIAAEMWNAPPGGRPPTNDGEAIWGAFHVREGNLTPGSIGALLQGPREPNDTVPPVYRGVPVSVTFFVTGPDGSPTEADRPPLVYTTLNFGVADGVPVAVEYRGDARYMATFIVPVDYAVGDMIGVTARMMVKGVVAVQRIALFRVAELQQSGEPPTQLQADD